jgi:hypothetical protein
LNNELELDGLTGKLNQKTVGHRRKPDNGSGCNDGMSSPSNLAMYDSQKSESENGVTKRVSKNKIKLVSSQPRLSDQGIDGNSCGERQSLVSQDGA